MSDANPSRNTRSKRRLSQPLMLDEKSFKRRRGHTADDTGILDSPPMLNYEEEESGLNEEAKDNEDDKERGKMSDSIVEDLICPITRELPWDPVTAGDGRVYERSAIEQHMRNNRHDLRSPMTNERMQATLLPTPQIKNLIQTLIDNGVITGDIVDAWKLKLTQQKRKEELLREAEAGDVRALGRVATSYNHGINGFPVDKKLSFFWSNRAHYAGDIKSTARIGFFLVQGEGTEQDTALGVVYISIAAANGSDFAAYRLGMALALGRYHLPINVPEAIKWLTKATNNTCEHRHLRPARKIEARQLLAQLRASESQMS